MATVDNPFQQVLVEFKKRLTKDEETEFRFSSLEDVLLAAKRIETEQREQKKMMKLTRIQRFIEAMHHYGQVIEVFLNASELLCFVWGPMKFCLQVASTWAHSFDTLLGAYSQLAENIPLIAQHQVDFKNSTFIAEGLAAVYEDILEFHQASLRFFKRPTWKQLFRSAWSDFETRFQGILNNLSRHKDLVERRAGILQFQEARESRAEARKKLAEIQEIQNHERYRDIVSWLCAVDSILDHEAALMIRDQYPLTGQWVLQDPKIRVWMDSRNTSIPILWMNGIPGAGKTILTSLVIDQCLKMNSVTTIYFYCNYQDLQKTTFVAVARSLLAQLITQKQQNAALLSYLNEKYMASGQVSLVSSQLCAEILETSLNTMAKVYIILDGLDECEVAERKTIITFFTSIIERCDTPGKLCTLIVSRDENDIRKSLRSLKSDSVLRLTESHSKGDIEGYTSIWSKRIQDKFHLSDRTTDHIKSATCDGSDGMFLFAVLVLSNLYHQPTIERLSEELLPGKFPKGFEQAYDRIVVRVYSNPNENEREIAKRLLGWIACSKRALKWHEIQGAVSMNVEDQDVDFENRRICAHVKDICGSLITVLPGDRVQLVHETAKHYLVNNDYVQIHKEEHKLATLCLQYLLFDCFDPDLPEEEVKKYTKNGYYAFQDYAILHWIDHLMASIQHVRTETLENGTDLGAAVNDFQNAYGCPEAGIQDVPRELEEQCQFLKTTNFFENLLLLVSSTRRIRGKEESMIGLGELGATIMKNREILESLRNSSDLPTEVQSNLEQYYGPYWYKCPRHACYYFHEGFPEPSRRDNHIIRHEKPFFCIVSSCPRLHIGFSTEKELKKHNNLQHPDPAVLFPKIKKTPPKHVCDECSAEFTRSHKLKEHKQALHSGIRPFACSVCSKTYPRKSARDRHQQTIHGRGKEQLRQDSQATLVEVDSQSEDLLKISDAQTAEPSGSDVASSA